MTLDGGPDENPRYQHVIKAAVHHFWHHDFDAVFLAIDALEESSTEAKDRLKKKKVLGLCTNIPTL